MRQFNQLYLELKHSVNLILLYVLYPFSNK